MRTVRFEGFGLNWRTGLLVALVAFMLSGTLLVMRPLIQPNGSHVGAATPPCDPHGWQSKNVSIIDTEVGGPGGTINIAARVKWNGCDVTAEDIQCWSTWIINIVAIDSYGQQRHNTETAYGEYTIVRCRASVSPILLPFARVSHVVCAKFDRNGRWFGYYGGLDVTQCGYPAQTK